MSEIEYEYEDRQLIDKKTYDKMYQYLKSFKIPTLEVIHTNYYFDNDNFDITNNHGVIRIRQSKEDIVLEFKIRIKDYHKEIHIPLDEKEKDVLIQNGLIMDKSIIEKDNDLKRFENMKFKYVGNLTTKRLELSLVNRKYVLDENSYFDIIDYNIEVESTSTALSKSYLFEFMTLFELDYQKHSPSKSKRVFDLIKKRYN